MQLCVFIGRNFVLLIKLGLTWMINPLILLTKSVLVPLRLTAVADTGIHKKGIRITTSNTNYIKQRNERLYESN